MADTGRPSKYKPEFCERMVELAKEGKSFAQIAAEFDVGRASIDDWTEAHPEFAEARARAEVHAQAWWEQKAVENLVTPGFNSQVWKKSMEARFRRDYTERQELTGKDGDAIRLNHELDAERFTSAMSALSARINPGRG